MDVHMKILTDSFPTRVLLFVFFALLAMSQLAPLQSNTILPNQADLANHIAAIIQAAMELTAHQFPLRIAPLQYGLSYPYFQFYAPTSYMYAAFIYKWFIPNPYIAYKFTIWSVLVFGGIYLYRVVHWLTKSAPAALLAATVFLTAPYLNILVGALGAFNEIIAIALIPFILYYTLRDYKNPTDTKNLLLASLGWYLLITTHIITFIFSGGLIGLLLFFLTCQTKQWKNLIRVFIAILFSCAMATWFLGPEILLASHFSVASSFPNAENIFSSSSTLASLLSPTLNKIMNMQQNVMTRAHEAIGLPVIIAVGVAIYAICKNSVIIKKNEYDDYIVPLVIIFLIAFFLLWSPVNVWKWLPHSLLVIQYTMRMLAQLIWIGPLIFAWAICWLFNHKLDIKHVAIGMLLIFAATNSLLPTLASAPYSVKDIVKKPVMLFNPDSYMIDSTDNPQFVTQIDNYQLDTLSDHGTLALNKIFYVPRSLLQLAKNPELNVQGYILHKNNSYVLQVMMDHQVMGALTLRESKPLSWRVPLSLSLIKSTKDLLPLQFVLKPLSIPAEKFADKLDGRSINKLSNKSADKSEKNNPDITIQADKVELTGFLNSATVLNQQQLKDACHYIKEELICRLFIPKNIELLELPMLYYPKLLKVNLNGKSISYHGVLSNERIMVGIIPEAGTNNVIKAKFVGLPWANMASQISWAVWGLIFLGYLWLMVFKSDHP
jgi:hypothetical protein